jgi:hypothetical protein
MRSDLVFRATTNVSNRYLLAQVVSKAARKLHRSGTRMQDTTNDVLVRFSRANPIGRELALRDPLLDQLHPKMTSIVPHNHPSPSGEREIESLIGGGTGSGCLNVDPEMLFMSSSFLPGRIYLPRQTFRETGTKTSS